jgi:WhiB family redox-sensing transcriptional regulator
MLTSCPTEPLSVASAPAASGPTFDPISRRSPHDLPCRVHDPDLWFAETPAELEQAKEFCADCPARIACLDGAISRGEPWGVWGGAIFERGQVVARKRPRGRPRKNDVAA